MVTATVPVARFFHYHGLPLMGVGLSELFSECSKGAYSEAAYMKVMTDWGGHKASARISPLNFFKNHIASLWDFSFSDYFIKFLDSESFHPDEALSWDNICPVMAVGRPPQSRQTHWGHG